MNTATTTTVTRGSRNADTIAVVMTCGALTIARLRCASFSKSSALQQESFSLSGFLVSILGYRFTGNGEDIRRNGERIGVLFARDSAKAASIDSLRYSVRAVLTMTCINFTITHATQVPIECDAVLRRIP